VDAELVDRCADATLNIAFGEYARREQLSVWMFVSHSGWQSEAPTVARRGIWRSSEHVKRMHAGLSAHGPDVKVSSEWGVLYCSAARVDRNRWGDAIRFVRRNFTTSALLMSREGINTERSIHQLFGESFYGADSERPRLSPTRLVGSRCPQGDIVVGVLPFVLQNAYHLDFYGTPTAPVLQDMWKSIAGDAGSEYD
jgi:hypothetical protein